MIEKQIGRQVDVIAEAIDWAREFGKTTTFPIEEFKKYRRRLKTLRDALGEKCSAAAYGESQVGKSYLMSSLLSSAETPFTIENRGRQYSFIDQINASGGNNTKNESTGVITRFTVGNSNEGMKDYVKVRTLSVVDLIMLFADSYYNDVKIDVEKSLTNIDINDRLNKRLKGVGQDGGQQHYIDSDAIHEIADYIRSVIGNAASSVNCSQFFELLEREIANVKISDFADIFSLLWNDNQVLKELLAKIISQYEQIGFSPIVYIPFEAVLRESGTLLNIEWLDEICNEGSDSTIDKKYKTTTDIFDTNGRLVVSDFSKSYLTVLTAELTFVVSKQLEKDKPFLRELDLLDFPGARSRERIEEQSLKTSLSTIIRRGKVAYLFNKYSRSLRLSSVLFCHHNDQKAEPTTGETINSWILENIGADAEQREKYLAKTSEISPLFVIATKFNIDLEKTKNDTPGKLHDHWSRFEKTLPEILGHYDWFKKWVPQGGVSRSSCFRGIYPLRDFYWSGKNKIFDGYSDKNPKSPEKALHIDSDYPDYFADLKSSFLTLTFVREHFANPQQVWNDVATVNHDGSKPIIEGLNNLAPTLNNARQEKFSAELDQIKGKILRSLYTYYIEEAEDAKNRKVQSTISSIRLNLDFSVGENQAVFGKIIDSLMINSTAIKNIAYNIIICRSEVPQGFGAINHIRIQAGINVADDREINIKKLEERFNLTKEELEADYALRGYSLEDVISSNNERLTTVADIVVMRIIEYWSNHLSEAVKYINDYLPHSDEVVFMLKNLLHILGVNRILTEKITLYTNLFAQADQPNAIADISSLILNNFVSTIGYQYLSEEQLNQVAHKAELCEIRIDKVTKQCNETPKPTSLVEVLNALDDSIDSLRGETRHSAERQKELLMKLPMWANCFSWENLLFIGLLLSSDIADVDPKANAKIKTIIERCEYK